MKFCKNESIDPCKICAMMCHASSIQNMEAQIRITVHVFSVIEIEDCYNFQFQKCRLQNEFYRGYKL